jgi:deoxyribodipyrimidine photo-lyase
MVRLAFELAIPRFISMPNYADSICWFRRDLRLHDHAALHHALKQSTSVHCVFVFDTDILGKLENRQDRRVEFIWLCLSELNERLQQLGSTLHVLNGKPCEVIPRFARNLNVQAIFCNHDYEPDAIQRDQLVAKALAQESIAFHHYKDQVIFDQSEIMNGSGNPFKVFTPYKNAWQKKLDEFYMRAYPVEKYFSALAHCVACPMPTLESLGFEKTDSKFLKNSTGESGADKLFAEFINRIDHYRETRDYPAVNGGSYLSTHLRFGTISIRQLVSYASHSGGAGALTWLNELIWREFYQMLLHHHPQLAQDQTFKPHLNAIKYTNSSENFSAWCEARTGFPLIDAAMHQLNQTGYMHNRLRMVTASFLVKDLQIDWRWGERYFAQYLLDFDLASNNGGWQWVASTGCDAQPWFRIFNPITQSEKFDKEGKFIRRYLPKLEHCPNKWIHTPWLMPASEQQRCGLIIGKDYPSPIVDHALARIKTLALYQEANSLIQ